MPWTSPDLFRCRLSCDVGPGVSETSTARADTKVPSALCMDMNTRGRESSGSGQRQEELIAWIWLQGVLQQRRVQKDRQLALQGVGLAAGWRGAVAWCAPVSTFADPVWSASLTKDVPWTRHAQAKRIKLWHMETQAQNAESV